ncbi:MAG: hypothetical protein NTY61_03880, partial [Candidatus Parcubacteria bacterium]|nr:hypothetical protein [Candidatus Parcubacteria bacterium]
MAAGVFAPNRRGCVNPEPAIRLDRFCGIDRRHFHYVGGNTSGAAWQDYDALRQYMSANLPSQLSLPRIVDMHFIKSDAFQLFPSGSQYTERQLLGRFSLGFIRGLADRIRIVEGTMPQVSQVLGDGLQVLMSKTQADKLGLQVGDHLELFNTGSSTATPARPRVEQTVTICGIWEPVDTESDFWYISPSAFDETLLLPEEAYVTLASNASLPGLLYNIGWYQTFNGASIHSQNVLGFLGRISAVQTQVTTLLNGTGLDISPISALIRYQRTASSQAVQLIMFLI